MDTSVKALRSFLVMHLKSVIMKSLTVLGKGKRGNLGQERGKNLQMYLHGTDLKKELSWSLGGITSAHGSAVVFLA